MYISHEVSCITQAAFIENFPLIQLTFLKNILNE